MKILNKTIPYKIRRLLPIAAIAAGSLMTASCDKDEPPHDVILDFWESPFNHNIDNIAIPVLESYAKDPNVINIYMHTTDQNSYPTIETRHFPIMREFFQMRFDVSPKIKGSGNFNFRPGVISEQDSLWFLSKGWTINKQLQKQK